ncbi:MAG TPA: aminoglycoside phosphotransferase family protein, partial [Pseudobdellovibrionaceae bacterium]|nr:aminoglycoside phosphotransferase family protein [Pseudobdellovibrionaceae bacterium]
MNKLKYYIHQWQISDPEQIAKTFTSDLYRVKYKSDIAVLKILNQKGQKFEGPGAIVLNSFNGVGAVHLLQADSGAHLLEFVDGPQLKVMVEQKNDELAMDVLCEVIQKIHSYSGPIHPELISMEENFRALFEFEKLKPSDSLFRHGAAIARELIQTARDLRVLHGDIHHENILKHSVRGWIAIDPQSLFGERAYDLANSFYNPKGFIDLVASQDRIQRLADKFSRALGIEKLRILQYAFAYGCLSAAWSIEDGHSPEATLQIAREIERLLPSAGETEVTFSHTLRNPDAHYTNTKLAKLYDLDSGWSIEREFYLSLAGISKKRVLDL